jgi:CRP/FNR family transcriptional regulator
MVRSASKRCALCLAHGDGIFCGMMGRPREDLEREVATHAVPRGQAVFHAGALPHALYVIRSGRVKVFRLWPDGHQQMLRLLGPGEILGYRPLLAEEPYGASAEAVEDTTVCAIPREMVLAALTETPRLARELLAKLAREMRASEELMMDLIHRPVRERAARLLLRLLEDNRGAPNPGTIPSRLLKRKDMAGMIGTTPETFSRVMRVLAHRGALSLAPKGVRVLDRALLRRIAGEHAAE